MKKYRNTILFLIRFFGYGFLMIGLNMIFKYDAEHAGKLARFGEDSLTEMTQEIFLFLSSGMVLFAGLKAKEYRSFTNLLACFFLASFIREFNNYLEHWFYFVSVVLVIAGYLFIRDFKKLWNSAEKILSSVASAYLLIGLITTYVFSRFFGKTDLWKTIMGELYSRDAKNAGEECIELLGYTFLLIFAMELLILVFNRGKRRENS